MYYLKKSLSAVLVLFRCFFLILDNRGEIPNCIQKRLIFCFSFCSRALQNMSHEGQNSFPPSNEIGNQVGQVVTLSVPLGTQNNALYQSGYLCTSTFLFIKNF